MRWDDDTGKPLDRPAWATSIGVVLLLFLGAPLASGIVDLLLGGN